MTVRRDALQQLRKGVLAAGAAGRLADRGNVARAGKLFSFGILVSFAFIYGGGHSLTALIAGMLLLNAGVQGMHIPIRASFMHWRRMRAAA